MNRMEEAARLKAASKSMWFGRAAKLGMASCVMMFVGAGFHTFGINAFAVSSWVVAAGSATVATIIVCVVAE